jgi:group I intron endonuclease
MIIYIAKNKTNQKVYIGQTLYDLQKRIDEHIRISKSPKSKFHKAIKSYGSQNFDWDIIDTAKTKEELNEKEIKYIQQYNSIENGYNMVEGGTGGYNQYAVEVNKKKRGKKLKDIVSPQMYERAIEGRKRGFSNGLINYTFDKLDKETMTDIARRGAYGLMKTNYKHSKETIEKIRKSNQGKERSEETKQLISEKTKEGMKNVDWDSLMKKALDSRKEYWDRTHEAHRNKIMEYHSQGLKVKEIIAKLDVSYPTYYARVKELKKMGKL